MLNMGWAFRFLFGPGAVPSRLSMNRSGRESCCVELLKRVVLFNPPCKGGLAWFAFVDVWETKLEVLESEGEVKDPKMAEGF